jgi:hypothetical protein
MERYVKLSMIGELGNKTFVRKTKTRTNIMNVTSIPHSDKIIYHRQEDQRRLMD